MNGLYRGIPMQEKTWKAYAENRNQYDATMDYYVISDRDNVVIQKGKVVGTINALVQGEEIHWLKEPMLVGTYFAKKKEAEAEAWFAAECSYISKNSYVKTDFWPCKLLNLDTGEKATVIVAVDHFEVAARNMGFEVIRLDQLKSVLPWEIGLDRVDVTLKTDMTSIDGQLDVLVMQSKPLYDHLSEIYKTE
jgi:hypothetical protein